MTQSDAYIVIGVSVILLYILYRLKARLNTMMGKKRRMSCGKTHGERMANARHSETRDRLVAQVAHERESAKLKLENAEERGYFKAIKEENERLRAQAAIDGEGGK